MINFSLIITEGLFRESALWAIKKIKVRSIIIYQIFDSIRSFYFQLKRIVSHRLYLTIVLYKRIDFNHSSIYKKAGNVP